MPEWDRGSKGGRPAQHRDCSGSWGSHRPCSHMAQAAALTSDLTSLWSSIWWNKMMHLDCFLPCLQQRCSETQGHSRRRTGMLVSTRSSFCASHRMRHFWESRRARNIPKGSHRSVHGRCLPLRCHPIQQSLGLGSLPPPSPRSRRNLDELQKQLERTR